MGYYAAPGTCIVPYNRHCTGYGLCEHCGSDDNVTLTYSMTAYAERPIDKWHKMTGTYPPTMNPNHMLCTSCKEDYISYWTEMWDDYNRSRL